MTTAVLDPITDESESIVQSIATQIENTKAIPHPSGRSHKYPVIKGASVQRQNPWRPAEWNNLVASAYEVQEVDTSTWNYANNFRKLNMYERWTMSCACCQGPIMQCLYNETLNLTAEEAGAFLKTLAPIINKDSSQENETSSEPKPESTRRKKGTFKTAVNAEVADEVKSLYVSGKTIAEVADVFVIAPAVVRDFLSEEGVLRKRGQSINSSSETKKGFGRKKTMNDITPEILQQALSQFPAKGIVALAKELHVNPSLLSQAIKATGAIVKRGSGSTGKRGRVKVTLAVDKDIVAQGLQLLESMGVVAAAKELNVNPMELSTALKNAGAIIKRGKRK
jgi:hypothetical protein